ncbi:hypothetical protein SAMN04487948_104200 [Halogranum amylolyticum]|uniref:Uncharacterized protein n=1 Tax=Halogranum amylolyticum TaxID=660520 RepID=A0A1H8RRQ3_9EURY|nr:hypothetical protein [Halogranum amylolyticum]SEO69151.1 hypothetical protein SAMN04487948_104200 [Halogranum amylolyticum]
MTESDPLTDPIADAILGGSTYERLRLQRFSFFKQPVPRKLAWQSGLLFVLALVLPLAAGYPAETKALFASHSPTAASPKMLLLGLVGGGIELGTASALVAVTVRRLQLEPDLTEDAARRLLNVEDVATLVGVVTGGFAVLLTLAFFVLGYAGPEAVAAFVESGGTSPFAPSGVGVSVTTLAVAALCGSLVVFASSVGLDRVLN